MEDKVRVLVVVNADNVSDRRLRRKIKKYQQQPNVEISISYVVPKILVSHYINLSFVAEGTPSAVLHNDIARQDGEHALRAFAQKLNVPRQRQHLLMGSFAKESRELVRKLKADVVLGRKDTLFELLQKTKLYKAVHKSWNYISVFFIGYKIRA